MNSVRQEIEALEERLRPAELGPDRQPFCAKQKVVEAHRPGKGPKFTRAESGRYRSYFVEFTALVS
jgi:hypothetical protein